MERCFPSCPLCGTFVHVKEDSTLSANIRAEIARQRLTYAAVANGIGMDPRQFRRRTRGEAPWGAAEVIAVARHLGTTVDELAKEK